MEQTVFEYEGAEFFVDFEYDPGERPTYDDPGYPAETIIHSITHHNVEMIEMLSDSLLSYIAQQITRSMRGY